MQKASQYHLRAQECRGLAARATKPDHKVMLGQMAETWDDLAEQRERLIARRERIAALEDQTEHSGFEGQPVRLKEPGTSARK